MTTVPDSLYVFDQNNPLPLIPKEALFNQRSKTHAKNADKFYGFEIDVVEERVRKDRHTADLTDFETWAHLDPQIFLTPYLELRYIVANIPVRNEQTFVDLGCAYARLPIVLSELFDNQVHFIGYDCVPHRILESKRVLRRRAIKAELATRNICAEDFSLPRAEHFFIYDTGTTSDIEKLLEKLRILATPPSSPIKSLVVRGARVRQIIDQTHRWLPVPAEKNQNFSIYLF